MTRVTDAASEPAPGDAGDDPIEAATQDRLGRTTFAERVAGAIKDVEGHDTSCVFGLVGPWGSGKTSVLNLVRTSFDGEGCPWTVVDFSAWMVSDLETLVVEYFASLASALGTGDPSITDRLESDWDPRVLLTLETRMEHDNHWWAAEAAEVPRRAA